MSTIPLLPVFVNPIKDAARSARDRVGQMVEKIKEVTVTHLLDLPEFVVGRYRFEHRGEQEILHLYCTHQEGVAICPRCLEISTRFHDGKERCVRDLDVWGKCTFLHFTSRRFECEHCGRPFTEKLPSIEAHRRQTRRFEQAIYRRCLSSTCKRVAQETFLHEATTKEIFKRFAKRTATGRGIPRVRMLGIDEIALKKRHKQYALILSDLERRCVIAVLPERSKDRLEQWFEDLSKAQRKAIRTVSIDMWDPYRQAVYAKLPHAQLVADRFHVMKQLNDRLTQMRRAIQRQADDATKQALKGSRWLLVNNRDTLTQEEQIRLQEILDASPGLRTLYLLKEEFRTICEKCRDQEQAKRFLRAWVWKAEITEDPFLRKFVKTLKNWWQEILNYFHERVTNGFVEGINRAIRTLINRAYGYRNFDNFRLHVLAQHPPPEPLSH